MAFEDFHFVVLDGPVPENVRSSADVVGECKYQFSEFDHGSEGFDLMKIGLAAQGMAIAANKMADGLIKFSIKHTSMTGDVTEYEGIFPDSIEATKDCLKSLGPGKIKVVAL